MDQEKLMMRVKNKTDNEKLMINSLMYFVADTVVYTVNDLVRQKSTLVMAWLDGEMLRTKNLYEPESSITISKVLKKSEKEAMLIMISDGTVIIISTKDPKGFTPQITKQPSKPS
jgi:protease II